MRRDRSWHLRLSVQPRIDIAGKPRSSQIERGARIVPVSKLRERHTKIVCTFRSGIELFGASEFCSRQKCIAFLQEERSPMEGSPPAFSERPWPIGLENLGLVGAAW